MSIILPVGISFYTFQTLSYTIDVYRKQIQPVKDPIAFFAYVSFFPQLVAGPIERAKNLIPQFLNTRVFNHALASEGLRQILWGLFKKVIVADNCAVLVDYIFNDYQNQNSIVLVLGAVFFAFQIYGDFSGYSDMAIGISKLLGIRLMRNFNYPYFASNISEFWKRWHISLTTWFKDYLYIPLGGSRTSLTKQVRNVFIIFLVSGFWHGANWTFIFWGLLNAFFFLPFIFIKSPDFFRGSWKLFGKVIGIGFTFACVTLGWIFFRSESLAGAFNYINGILSFDFVAVSEYFLFPIPFIILMLVIELFNRKNEFGFQRMPSKQWQRWPIYLGMIVIILAFLPQSKQSFIYFQF
ncbi:MAG: MBOAT family O-acyltransferase [Cytophagaceae bacterium]